MKILFFINGLHPGGKERRMLELMKELKLKKEIEFELVLMNKEISYPEIFDMDVKLHFLIRKTKKDFSIFKRVYKICKEYEPDIIHCWDSMTAIYAIPASKLLNIKLMNGMVVDSPSKNNILNKNWLRAKLTFPFSDIIVGNSVAGLSAYKAPTRKSYCIHNGYNFRRSTNLSDIKIIRNQLDIHTKYIIGMVAAFSKYKDYKTFYEAAKLILKKRQDITFIAIGNNTNSVVSKQMIENEFKKYFKLLGQKTDIETFINAMDICVLATFSEGISNSILEYMALGKPVIATLGGGTIEIVEDNKTGYLVKVSDIEEMANKMEYLLNNPELRNQMGINGQLRIQNLFSINLMVKKFVALYEKLGKEYEVNKPETYEFKTENNLENRIN